MPRTPLMYITNTFLYGAPTYEPEHFVGMVWLCDPLAGNGESETCFAGLRYMANGQTRLLTGP